MAMFGIGFVLVLIGGMVAFSIGLDWSGNTINGGIIERALNFVTTAYMWIGLVVVAGALLLSKWFI